MAVEKLRNANPFTDRKGEVGTAADPCAKGSNTLRALDVLDPHRVAEIVRGGLFTIGDPTGFIAPLRTFSPAAQRARRRKPLKRRFETAEAWRLANMHKALQVACRVSVLQSMPGPSERTVAPWEMLRVSQEDYGHGELVDGPDGVRVKHKAPRCAPARPSAAEVDLATKVFELVFAIKVDDAFAAYLAIARAMPKAIPWKEIAKMDPKGRGRFQLGILRNNVLKTLLDLADERGVKVDIFAVDTVAKKTA